MNATQAVSSPAVSFPVVPGAAPLIPEAELPQGSPQWLDFRRKALGGSDMCSLMARAQVLAVTLNRPEFAALQATQTPSWANSLEDIVAQKRGAPSSFKGNVHTERGHRVEPKIRDVARQQYGLNFEPCCIVVPGFEHVRVSYDGVAFDDKNNAWVLECKAPANPWEEIPEYVIDQVSYQVAALLLSGYTVGGAIIGEGREEPRTRKTDVFLYPLDEDMFNDAIDRGVLMAEMAEQFYITYVEDGEMIPAARTAAELPPEEEAKTEKFRELATAWKTAKTTSDTASDAESSAKKALTALVEKEFPQGIRDAAVGVEVVLQNRKGSFDSAGCLAGVLASTLYAARAIMPAPEFFRLLESIGVPDAAAQTLASGVDLPVDASALFDLLQLPADFLATYTKSDSSFWKVSAKGSSNG